MRIQLRNRFFVAMPTPLAWRKAASGQPLCEVGPGSPESLARGMLSKGFPVNPGELAASAHTGRLVPPNPNGTWSAGGEGCPRQKRTTLKRSLLPPRETGGAGMGRREVLRVHTTDEGGEPQGSRKGRPRYPLEGRDEQVGASGQCHIDETQNSGKDVKWR